MTYPPQKILFASDLSKDMRQVFEHAVSTAACTGATIVVLHVFDTADESRTKMALMAFGKNLYEDIKTRHKQGAQTLLSGKNMDALKIKSAIENFLDHAPDGDEDSPILKILVTEGSSVADTIVEVAGDEGCDLIVMGTRHHSALSQAMGNRVIRRLVRQSPVPTLVVPIL